MKSLKTIMISLLIALVPLLNAQPKPPNNYEELKNRIDKLDETIVEEVKVNFENKSGQLENRFGELKNSNDAWQKEIENNLFWLKVILTGGGIFTLITIYFGVKKFAENKANEIFEAKFTQKMGKLLETNKKLIVEMIDSHKLEKELIKKAKISVISNESEEESAAYKMLLEIGCNAGNIDKEDFENAQKFSRHTDIVIFDNPDQAAQELLFASLEQYKELPFFLYYGSDNLDREKIQQINPQNLNFSNTPITLYARIMDVLKFKESRLNS